MMFPGRDVFYWFALIVLAALVQATWLEAMTIRGVMPSLIITLFIYAALTYGEEGGMYAGAFGGILEDVSSNAALGHHVLCHVIVAYVAGRVASRLITEHPAVKAALVLLAALSDGLLFLLVSYIRDPRTSFFDHFASNVVPAAFYTALITPLVFVILDRLLQPRLRAQKAH